MKLHLTSAYATHRGLDTLRVSAGGRDHATADDADAILFVEDTHFDDVLFHDLLQHPLMRRYPDKCFMYNEMDRPWDVIPGLYCCMPRKHLDPVRHRAFAYLSTPNPCIDDIHTRDDEPLWLYSFMGSMSHACRRPLMRLRDDLAFLQDTSDFNVWKASSDELQRRGRHYAEIMAGSRFILCPRGIGTSSLRLFETMEAARVPVIISDDWVPPPETDWAFAIKVREDRIESIPGLLRALAGESRQRGEAAREAWEQTYAPSRLFDTVSLAISELLGNEHHHRAGQGSTLHKWLASSEMLTRSAARRLLNH